MSPDGDPCGFKDILHVTVEEAGRSLCGLELNDYLNPEVSEESVV